MTESSNIPNRVDRLENDAIDIKVAVSALISTTEVHQRNFETINRNIETMNRNMEIHQRNMEATNRNVDAMLQLMTQSLQRMEVVELDIRGLQTENRRILDILQHRNTDGE
ncbi:hypothetical protein QUB68_16265 [Microcoleus sp. A006_D1]|uniref:hypothetical protein n=1 Tax=Microcoleus sp. A006_D1 TaxID=3055267 RepID=UPI002FCF7963